MALRISRGRWGKTTPDRNIRQSVFSDTFPHPYSESSKLTRKTLPCLNTMGSEFSTGSTLPTRIIAYVKIWFWLSVRNSVWGPFNRILRGNPPLCWLGGGVQWRKNCEQNFCEQTGVSHVFLNRVQQTVSGNKPPHSTLRTPFAGHCLGALWGGKPCPVELSEGLNRVLRTLSGDPPLPILQTPSAGHCLDTRGYFKITYVKNYVRFRYHN